MGVMKIDLDKETRRKLKKMASEVVIKLVLNG